MLPPHSKCWDSRDLTRLKALRPIGKNANRYLVSPAPFNCRRHQNGVVEGVVARMPGRGLLGSSALPIPLTNRMPNKHNAKCRHHIPKMKFSVRNWAEYDAALRARDSLTLWVTPEAMDHWAAQPRSTPGGQGFYSDLAIETSLMLRFVLRHHPRRAILDPVLESTTNGLVPTIECAVSGELRSSP